MYMHIKRHVVFGHFFTKRRITPLFHRLEGRAIDGANPAAPGDMRGKQVT